MRRITSGSIRCLFTVVVAVAITICSNPAKADAVQVNLLKTPNGGIQPQAVMDSKNILHLIYFKGAPMAGDIFYVRRLPGETTFSPPLRVNSFPNSAIATGTIRGAQISLGRDGRIHVAWNGSGSAEPKGAAGNPMLYTRLNDEGTSFEPQRNLITWAGGVDGGGTVAADAKGNVFVAWHADPADQDDANRAVYLARSTDDGLTFEAEKKISVEATGACACCQMRAFVDSKGVLAIAYRAAGENVNRDSTLLVSSDAGDTFRSTVLHPWKVNMCPMSSYFLSESQGRLQAAWETAGQIYSAAIDPATLLTSTPIVAPGKGNNRKHPVAIHNPDGEMLMAWTENTGWNKGGTFVWQVFDKDGKATAEKGRQDDVPVWGLLTSLYQPDGSFLLIY